MQAMPEHSTAYLDQAGRPLLRQSVVAFFDILGFSEASTSSAAAIDSQHVLDKIVAAIEDSRDFVRQSFPDSELAEADHWGIKFFSDNLAFGYPFDSNVADPATTVWFIIRCAQRYQFRMAMNGYFLRGALTQGPICLTDEIIFGRALVECYQLESKASIVPRVILTEPLRQLVLTPGLSDADQSSLDARDSICRDVDGWWFLNYLEAAREGSEINWDVRRAAQRKHSQIPLHDNSSRRTAKIWMGMPLSQRVLPLASRRTRLLGSISHRTRR